MNGTRKFHKATGPAFNSGERWLPCDGSRGYVTIVSVRQYGDEKWDHEVSYRYGSDDHIFTKDAWNFQVRYYHQADREL